MIKSNKLISCGGGNANSPLKSPTKQLEPVENLSTLSLSKRNSKVLINPVPVDIGKKSRLMRRDSASSHLTPEKKPTSILKQSSSVLTRSLSGISAIDFN